MYSWHERRTRVNLFGLEILPAERVNRREETDFARIYADYGALVYNTCLAMLGDADDARDATQDTFVQVLRALHGFRGECELSTWIYRIAVRKCLDYARKRRRTPLALDDLHEATAEAAPDSSLEHDVRAALLALKPAYRIVLVLYHFRQMSYQEIAAALQCSVDQVRVRLHRARNAFRARYRPSEGAL